MDSLDFSVVLQFNVERFRQQKTEATSNNGHDAVDQQGDGVMVGGQQCDQRGEDGANTAAHGRYTHSILPAGGGNVVHFYSFFKVMLAVVFIS